MDALAGSGSFSSELFSRACRNRARSSSTFVASIKPAIHFSVSRKVSGELSCLGLIRSVPISVSAQTEDGAEAVDSNTHAAYQSATTVHVRFLLQKECMFGEHFYLIGDDPSFGFWDPSAAIPMEWSDGHVWKTEMDIPVGMTIQFKFILKGLTEEIEWQPGPDRILQTWETKNTIVISEDWFSAEFQKITEESVVTPTEELSIAEIVGSNGRAGTDEEVVVINDQSSAISSGSLSPETPVSPEGPLSSEGPLKFRGALSPEGPVLVPGLSSPPDMLATDEEVLKEIPNEQVEVPSISVGPVTATSPADEARNHGIPESKNQFSGMQERAKSIDNKHEEETMMACDEPEGKHAPAEVADFPAANVLKNDLDWGLQTLSKFIQSLGF